MIWFLVWAVFSIWLVNYSVRKHLEATGVRKKLDALVEELEEQIEKTKPTPTKGQRNFRIVK